MDRKDLIAKVCKINGKVEVKMDANNYIKGMSLIELLEEYDETFYMPSDLQEDVGKEIRKNIYAELQKRISRSLRNMHDCGPMLALNCIMTGRLER